MIGQLPTTLDVAGKAYKIRTDFRTVLRILEAFSDPDLDPSEKIFACLYNLYPDFSDMPGDVLEDAYKQALFFIDAGADKEGRKRPRPRLMDWAQDERLIFPAVNKVAGFETRTADYLHWWTFAGYFMEIGEGTYSQILSLRHKKATGKQLEKWEREWWAQNKDVCQLRPQLSAAEIDERAALLKMID